MEVKKIYHEDLQIAKALIQRDNLVTRKYFYQQRTQGTGQCPE